MILKQLIIFTFSLFLSSFLVGQNDGFCGTTDMDLIKERLLANKKNFNKSGHTRTNATTYIPITFHLVANSSGQGRAKEYKVIEQLCALNADYEDVGVVFFLKDGTFNYIDHTATYNTPGNTASATKMTLEKNSAGANSVNVFVCQNANTPGGVGTTLGYYDSIRDWIVIRINDVNATSGTLSHEVGHFFSLMHTFNGWDGTFWNAAEHGNPVSSQSSPGGVTNELADGSNCETAGDFLCDTPADYNLGFGWDGCNPYTGGCKDFNGQLLDPDEPNFMGYFIGCSQYHFSGEQKNMVLEDYETIFRQYLHTSHVPNEGFITGSTDLIYPAQDESVPFTNVELEWEEKENADSYLVTVQRLLSEWTYITTSNKLWLTDLDANKTYNWYVRPFNESGGCASISSTRSFTTGGNSSASQDLASVSGLEIFPNPALTNDEITISFELESSTDLKFEIFNLQGKLIYGEQYNGLAIGIQNFNIPSNQLDSGMFIVRLSNNDGQLTKKIAVQ